MPNVNGKVPASVEVVFDGDEDDDWYGQSDFLPDGGVRITINLQAIKEDSAEPVKQLICTVGHELCHVCMRMVSEIVREVHHCLSARPGNVSKEDWEGICMPFCDWNRDLVCALPLDLGITENDIDRLR